MGAWWGGVVGTGGLAAGGVLPAGMVLTRAPALELQPNSNLTIRSPSQSRSSLATHTCLRKQAALTLLPPASCPQDPQLSAAARLVHQHSSCEPSCRCCENSVLTCRLPS